MPQDSRGPVDCATCALHGTFAEAYNQRLIALDRKVGANCHALERLDEEVHGMIKELDRKVDGKAEKTTLKAVLIGGALGVLGLVGSFLYLGQTVGAVPGVVTMAVADVEKSVNKRISECMDHTNNKLSELTTDVARLSTKQSTILEGLQEIKPNTR